MKWILAFGIFLGFLTSYAQDNWSDLVKDQAQMPVYNNLNGMTNAGKASVRGPVNPLSKIAVLYNEYDGVNLSGVHHEGSVYLFDTWKNKGYIEVDNKRYIFGNINFNIKRNTIMSKFSGDSLYVFDLMRADRVVINNREFKSFFYPKDQTNRIFEVLFSDGKNYLLKGYSVSFIEASVDPMINRKTNRIVKDEKYFVFKDDKIQNFKLNKSNLFDFLKSDPVKLEHFKKFMKENKKSYKNDKDVKQALRYCNQIR